MGVGSFLSAAEEGEYESPLASLLSLFNEAEFRSLVFCLLLLLVMTLLAAFSTTSLDDSTPLGVDRPPTPLFRCWLAPPPLPMEEALLLALPPRLLVDVVVVVVNLPSLLFATTPPTPPLFLALSRWEPKDLPEPMLRRSPLPMLLPTPLPELSRFTADLALASST